MPDILYRIAIKMIICQNVFSIIINISRLNTVEIGGIIGGIKSRRKEIISRFRFDDNCHPNKSVCYVPNTKNLNKIIAHWQERGTTFYGIFHSHLDTSEQLSSADKEYIKNIMLAMPDEVDHLYFPLVLPKCGKLIAFKAIRHDNQVDIIKDDIEIIKK